MPIRNPRSLFKALFFLIPWLTTSVLCLQAADHMKIPQAFHNTILYSVFP